MMELKRLKRKLSIGKKKQHKRRKDAERERCITFLLRSAKEKRSGLKNEYENCGDDEQNTMAKIVPKRRREEF